MIKSLIYGIGYIAAYLYIGLLVMGVFLIITHHNPPRFSAGRVRFGILFWPLVLLLMLVATPINTIKAAIHGE